MSNKSDWQNQSAKKSEAIRTYLTVRTILVSSHTRDFVRMANFLLLTDFQPSLKGAVPAGFGTDFANYESYCSARYERWRVFLLIACMCNGDVMLNPTGGRA